MSLASGTVVGPYEVVAPLGHGGMGEVWRARDRRLGRDVALKALPARVAGDPESLARFEREARLLASLNHPNIATIHGVEDGDGGPYLVLELIEGESLAARLGRGPLPVGETLRLAVHVAAAIEAAHERGIVHRDLKPGNVMLVPGGGTKVVDFGIARQEAAMSGGSAAGDVTMAAATRSESITGTAAYMSPEQVRGAPTDRRSDLWSFACLVFECLAGASPFVGATPADTLARILERDPDWSALPDGTPPRMKEILRRCLRKDAADRPRDIRDVRLELAELAAGGGAAPGEREKSVAVLPFENLSGPDDEYFADGVTDEILNALAGLDRLKVAGRASSFSFKGKRADLRRVGETLGVATVLEGSVRRAGTRIRITAQLADAEKGQLLWSERYDREITDVFAVQDEIARAIADRLRVTFHGGAERAGGRRATKSLEAYELVLKGRALQTKRGRFIVHAIACFEKAIALDPEYAEPLALLADSWRLLGTFGVARPAEVMPRAIALAERALALDPTSAEAWATVADVHIQYERDYPRAAEGFRRALECDPRHVRSRCEWASWGFGFGALSFEHARAETDRAIADDPLNAWVAGMSSLLLGLAGRHAESIVEAERSVAIDPDSFFGQWSLVRAHAWGGDHARALEFAAEGLASSGRHPWVLGTVGWSYGASGDAEKARAVHDELSARARYETIGPFWLATTAAAAGLDDEAIAWAERAVVERDALVVHARAMPVWDRVRAHPRFSEIVRGVWDLLGDAEGRPLG